ncbi:GAF domain-containing sensor histidine kinase [Romeria aff. gracilis LEGE 07310]|uniref:histidine kinase n=1 Tax=Vasconcelosia minhoensis LEGE 07310 TaxID=915328 RepID=A0A8J7AKQ1_9CYAN|nr:GAF domain-containing sensor histidine kinase [Romeria gracilis]MBE9076464.1 GAF domain-containing sensor histidine kinase [Romeria aff. gracilis LEGE 07310]
MNYGVTQAAASNGSDQVLETWPACLLAGPSAAERDQIREAYLLPRGLLGSAAVPLFDEATQTASRLLNAPICLFSVVNSQWQIFKSAVGLSNLGLMNQLAAARQIARSESFCTQVVESGKVLMIADTNQHPAFADSLLVQQYGVRAYLGVPLLTADQVCIGTLAVMDLLPRQFTPQDVAFLELSARWSLSEFEQQYRLQEPEKPPVAAANEPEKAATTSTTIDAARLALISQLTQDLRNPLTAITGMASMLSREIYGSLTQKQQEYASIILNSSQNLLTLADEIIDLSVLETGQPLSPVALDVEMLSQQALRPLENLAQSREVDLKLSAEPGSRLWTLDKQVIKPLIYHLTFSLILLSEAGSTVRLHISRKADTLRLTFWVSNPWLGENLPQPVVAWIQSSLVADSSSQPQSDAARPTLGLMLSRYLANVHQGETILQGSEHSGYRYVISLPTIKTP